MTMLQDSKSESIEQVLTYIRDRLPQDKAAMCAAFASEYYRWAAPEDLIERSPLDLYGAAMAHWNLAQRRVPQQCNMHVYTPQLESHGWQSRHTVIEIVTDDMPFLVDSVSMEITRHGYAIHLILAPIMHVRRDAQGQLLELLPPDATSSDSITESLLHVEVDQQREPAVLDELRTELVRVLGQVRAAVEDWPKMRHTLQQLISELETNPPPFDAKEVTEARDLLVWLYDDNFIFLGFRSYDLLTENGEERLHAVSGSGLGILRESGPGLDAYDFAAPPAEAGTLDQSGRLLTLTKANTRSPVHRPTHMDAVGIHRFDADGHIVGEWRFLGLYTTVAYHAHPRGIPVLRHKFNRVLARSSFPVGDHAYKALVDILETYPRDELFQITEDELFEIAIGILYIGERPQVRLFVRRDPYGRFLSCLVYLPRDRYNTENRLRIQAILQQQLHGTSVQYTAYVTESILARLHIIVYVKPDDIPTYDARAIEKRLAEATRSWTDDLHEALLDQCGEELGNRLFRRYRDAFPTAYRAEFHARAAVPDILRMEHLAPESDLALSVYRPLEAPERSLRFKVLRCERPITLSDILPVLETLDVRVVDERPYEIRPRDWPAMWMYDLGLVYYGEDELDTDHVKALFQDAFAQAWRGDIETDGFNRLVLHAQQSSREIAVLRAYSKYLRQTGSLFSQAYIEQSLANHPQTARLLLELFRTRFDPTTLRNAQAEAKLVEDIEHALDAVPSLDEDRILRSFLHLIRATLRTNFYQRGADLQPKPYLSFKFDPSLIPGLPLPRPLFEIFVYSPRMEGVHLRGARVARGGIRWSDRREDFRTEILGLMKAQTVKNAVIVPMGAKGGFVVKQPPANRDALLAEVSACYQTLIRGMLDLTDNLVTGQVIPPTDVVRYDDDDPYLVVAADKGTATFSDIANALAAEYGFWLGDAFASGGSAGYDHKQMGITSRGAWESVKRHFRELDMNVETTDFTVVGIGDMSGDVFGNGMLRSRHIKLIGAFNHQHIFLDPDPDPERSFQERERLFKLPRSSWADYDQRVISAGGGIFPRSAKSIPLSPEVRRRLAVEANHLTPNELVRALLKAPVDLLWNGGIGTYVKASDELHSEVGDKSNDVLRVDGRELRCRVVAEGGNLGFTQRGRIEYALLGGRINTDAIDNSAGVDCSDHEVNLKILLNALISAGDMTEKQRNQLLASMTEEVAALVLRDNYQQNQALSIAEAQAPTMLDEHAAFIRRLEQAGKLNRAIEFLPDDEHLAERATARQGLVRPELATLLAYSKITLYEELLASDLPDTPELEGELVHYFPTPVHERAAEPMRSHRLRREIIATRVTNSMINRMGSTFVYRLGEETGAAAADIARAFMVAREVLDAPGLWTAIEALDNRVAGSTQLAMMGRLSQLLERATRWLVRNCRPPLAIAATVSRFTPGVAALMQALPQLLEGPDRDTLEQEATDLASKGVPTELAIRVAVLRMLLPAFDIVDGASATGLPVETVAAVHFALGTRLQLHWLRDQILALPLGDRWQSLARAALRDDLYALHSMLTTEVLQNDTANPGAQERIDAWVAQNAAPVERWLQVLSDIKSGETFDFVTLSVAVHGVPNLIHPGSRVPAGRPNW